jgi:hypothetical protein
MRIDTQQQSFIAGPIFVTSEAFDWQQSIQEIALTASAHDTSLLKNEMHRSILYEQRIVRRTVARISPQQSAVSGGGGVGGSNFLEVLGGGEKNKKNTGADLL